MSSRIALATFAVASASLFGQLAKPAKPCPAGTSVPNVKGAPGFQPPKQRAGGSPEFPRRQQDSLEHLAYFTIPAGGEPCDIYVVGEFAKDNVDAILTALDKWRFTPAQVNGQAVATRASVSFRPRILAQEAPSPEYDQAVRLINSGDAARQSEGIQKLEALSEKALPQADSYLGLMLLTATKVPQDIPRGLKLLQRSLAKGDRFAFYVQGMLLEQGKAVPKDEKKAAEAYEQAAVRGMILAQEKLGDFYAAGVGVPRNLDRASALYRLCAAAGSNSCAVSLATLLQREGKFLDEALAWALLARNRGAQAAFALAQDLDAALEPDAKLRAQAFAGVLHSTRPPR